MKVELYSIERVRTGKWDIEVTRAEDPITYRHEIREPAELRCFVENHYELPTEELAVKILEQYLQAVAVKITDCNYNGVYLIVEKESHAEPNV